MLLPYTNQYNYGQDSKKAKKFIKTAVSYYNLNSFVFLPSRLYVGIIFQVRYIINKNLNFITESKDEKGD